MMVLMITLISLTITSCRKTNTIEPKEILPILIQEKTFSVSSPFSYTFTGLSKTVTYYLQVEGTYTFGGNGTWDASYAWAYNASPTYFTANSQCRAKWQLNGSCNQQPVPSQYQASHIYKFALPSNSSQITVSFHDCEIPSTTNCAYGDNDGALTFKIFQGALK